MSRSSNGQGETEPQSLEEALAVIATERQARIEAVEERRTLERQVLHSQKLESLGVLAAGIAHDFNNLLTGIIGNASMAMVQVDDRASCLRALQHIERAAERAAALTKQLLAYSGAAEFNLERVDLRSLVQEMTELLEVSISKHVSLALTTDIDVPAIRADASQMQQLVMNLITNASEAIGDRPGEIRVHLGVLDVTLDVLGQARFSEDLKAGSYVYLEVSDTGRGMDEGTVERMFDPFFSTKDSGRGLGLAAAVGILRAHQGAVHVESAVGQGSSIRVLLGASQGEVSSPAAAAEEASLTGHGTILVVDDDAAALEVSQNILEHFGCEVLLARDGQAAWDIYRKNANIIDLVLLDMTMPSMDGVAVLEQIRGVGGATPVVVMTGYSEARIRERFGQIQPCDILSKPFRVETFIQTVQRNLDKGVSGSS
jgi:two-component system cell cycle sensor histidine kinase/response regulator CckA